MTAATVDIPVQDRVWGVPIKPLTRRRIENFKANKRGYWSAWIFLVLFVGSLFAEVIANDRPLVIQYDGGTYFPFARFYPETNFGVEHHAAADVVLVVVDLRDVTRLVLGHEIDRRVVLDVSGEPDNVLDDVKIVSVTHWSTLLMRILFDATDIG